MSEKRKLYAYEAVEITRTHAAGTPPTANLMQSLNRLGAQGFRFITTFKLPAGDDTYVLMEQETEKVLEAKYSDAALKG
ncbi:MAG: hypothetical protein WBE37_29425 [Bryobacteraceae bacterium]